MDPTADPTPFLRGLYHLIPPDRIALILGSTGRQSRRVRRIPADATARLVVALGLFAGLPVPQVWRRLRPGTDDPDPVSPAFCQARDRLGVPPLRRLSEDVARPTGTHQTVGASYRGWRLMGLDGTTLDLPDTPDNARAFGRPGTARAAGAVPPTAAPRPVRVGAAGHLRAGHQARAAERTGHGRATPRPARPGHAPAVGPRVLRVPAGRAGAADGAHPLARVPARAVLAPTRRLSDGSYLAALHPSPADRAAGRRGSEVRVTEYTHDDPGRPGCGARARLLTDLLSPDDLPAADAPVVYRERWEQELAFGELKTHLGGRDVPVRSKTPAGVVQEAYGLALAYYLARRAIRDAAAGASVDPDRVSSAGALRVLWCRLPEAPGRPPPDWYRELLREVRRQRSGPRRERRYPRVVERKMSNWGEKRAEHLHPPQPTKPFREAVVVLI